MIYGVDSAYPGNFNQLITLGWSFAMGYVGGRAEHVWLPSDWRNASDSGMQLGPIWVAPSTDTGEQAGVDEGNSCLVAMQDAKLSGWVWDDVESGATPASRSKGFIDACHAGSLSVGLYGSYETIQAIGWMYDKWWLAYWIESPLTLKQAPPDWSMLQYATGPQFDFNMAVDDCPFATLGS